VSVLIVVSYCFFSTRKRLGRFLPIPRPVKPLFVRAGFFFRFFVPRFRPARPCGTPPCTTYTLHVYARTTRRRHNTTLYGFRPLVGLARAHGIKKYTTKKKTTTTRQIRAYYYYYYHYYYYYYSCVYTHTYDYPRVSHCRHPDLLKWSNQTRSTCAWKMLCVRVYGCCSLRVPRRFDDDEFCGRRVSSITTIL